MTRGELHELVWSQPIRTVARSMGISDVALAKQCKKANVPVPPRGWWARKEAGKPVKIEPLPPLPFVMTNYFPALAPKAPPGSESNSATETAPPDDERPPAFREIEEVKREIQASVRPLKIPTTLSSPHPTVARLLKQDEGRKAQTGTGFLTSYYGRKFSTPLQQRRLRILSSLVVELERLGCKIQGSTHAGEKFSVQVGGHWTYMLFGIEGPASMTPFHYTGRGGGRPAREGLRFDLINHDDRDPPVLTWRETEKPMEAQAAEIIRGIFIHVEQEARRWALWHHNDEIERRARAAREAKLADEKARAERKAREEAAVAARIKALIDGAEAFERAALIRRYVDAVRAGCPAVIPAASLDAWATWALAEADRIDPIASGQLLSQLAINSKSDERSEPN